VTKVSFFAKTLWHPSHGLSGRAKTTSQNFVNRV
jgi:hypothetical protein